MWFRSILAGFLIGFAALLSLCIENKIAAAIAFSIALLYIRISSLYLFTGQVQNLRNKTTNLKELFCGLLGNMIGVGGALLLLPFLAMGKEILFTSYEAVLLTKWNYPWYYYVVSGLCCGVLMTIATKKETPLWLSSACVAAFILAGFNHCVADWFYVGGTLNTFLKWFCIMIGNFVGGLIVATNKI